MSSTIDCSCCSKPTEKHLAVTCSVCKKAYSHTCAGITASEVRVINSRKSISWDCAECEKIGNDIKSLKSTLVRLQDEIKQLRTNVNSNSNAAVLSEDNCRKNCSGS